MSEEGPLTRAIREGRYRRNPDGTLRYVGAADDPMEGQGSSHRAPQPEGRRKGLLNRKDFEYIALEIILFLFKAIGILIVLFVVLAIVGGLFTPDQGNWPPSPSYP